MIDYRLLNKKPWSPVWQCITVNWQANHNYVPASKQPEIKAKHEYFKNLQNNQVNK